MAPKVPTRDPRLPRPAVRSWDGGSFAGARVRASYGSNLGALPRSRRLPPFPSRPGGAAHGCARTARLSGFSRAVRRTRAADLGARDVAHFIRMRGIGSPKVKLSLT